MRLHTRHAHMFMHKLHTRVLFLQVPRGFICPLTLDIMTQPALLISSNIAVPSSYEKEAISRWLAESRCDGRASGVCGGGGGTWLGVGGCVQLAGGKQVTCTRVSGVLSCMRMGFV